MKYLEYSYLLDVPIESAFSHIIDLKALHENMQLFDHGALVSDESKPEDIGKKYVLSMRTGNNTVETTFVVERIEIPNRIQLSYRYKILDSLGQVSNNSIFPWESMDCFIHFSVRKGKTMVKTIMIANGVQSFAQKFATRAFSIVNWFQQMGINNRVKTYIEGNA
jgi:hypothetical protein